MTIISENIRTALTAAGHSQHWLALALGVTDRTTARWLAGDATPDVATLRRIAAALGTTLAALVAEPETGG